MRYGRPLLRPGDRKSTRLNSSHLVISYAVFCLKKSIIISASGMATGGREEHHLMHLLSDPSPPVILTGYQAVGTRGRQLAVVSTYFKMFGRYLPFPPPPVFAHGF